MEYLYCPNDNFEDYCSGRVIYSEKGIPKFPVRLLNEMYGRAKSYLDKKENIIVYDPCCGGGYAPYAPTLEKLTKLLSGNFTFFNKSIFRQF